MSSRKADPAEVFIFSVTHVGDLVLATSTFEALRDAGHASLVVVAWAGAEPLLRGDPRVAEIHSLRAKNSLLWRYEVLREMLAAKRRRARIVNLELYLPRWNFIRRLAEVFRVEARNLDLPALTRDESRARAGETPLQRRRISYYARAIGRDGSMPQPPRIHISPDATKRILSRLRTIDPSGERAPLVIAPGSSDAARRAPVALYRAAAHALVGRPFFIVVVGNRSERSLGDEISSLLPGTIESVNWAGELDLEELPPLLRAARLFIGNDSGPLKIAEAVGARTVSFWGASSPSFAGPRGTGHRMLGFDASADECSAAVQAAWSAE